MDAMAAKIRAYLVRWCFWMMAGLLFIVAIYNRAHIDTLSLRAGNAQVNAYLFPNALGVQYDPEVYDRTLLKVRSEAYNNRPFRLGGHFDGFVKAPVPAPFLGAFGFYYQNNGGPHWTVSIGAPLLFCVGVVSFIGAFLRLPMGLRGDR